jgi:hypothetical protein
MDNRTIKRFRITNVEGPSDRGNLNQFHDYIFEIDLDPGSPYELIKAKILVTLFDTAFFALRPGDPRQSPYLEEGRSRLAHYVISTLHSLPPFSASAFPMKLNPTVEEVSNLRSIDPARVEMSNWQDVPTQTSSETRRVFISCGQQSAEEIVLGKAIVQAAKDQTGIDGYFAEYQHSLDGLTRNIFNAIHSASAFIAVIHRRDKLPTDLSEYRGSVWIEQEIAIAAFLAQSLGLRIPARVYVQKGIRREGVRGYIHLNPIEFESNEDVINDLEKFWPEIK